MEKKLIRENITGKCLKLIFNMYKGIKCQISTNEGSMAFFDCNIGVRQDENLSPILFTFYLNDLESFLSTRQVIGVSCDVVIDEHIFILNCLFYCIQMTQVCLVTIAVIYNVP